MKVLNRAISVLAIFVAVAGNGVSDASAVSRSCEAAFIPQLSSTQAAYTSSLGIKTPLRIGEVVASQSMGIGIGETITFVFRNGNGDFVRVLGAQVFGPSLLAGPVIVETRYPGHEPMYQWAQRIAERRNDRAGITEYAVRLRSGMVVESVASEVFTPSSARPVVIDVNDRENSSGNLRSGRVVATSFGDGSSGDRRYAVEIPGGRIVVKFHFELFWGDTDFGGQRVAVRESSSRAKRGRILGQRETLSGEKSYAIELDSGEIVTVLDSNLALLSRE